MNSEDTHGFQILPIENDAFLFKRVFQKHHFLPLLYLPLLLLLLFFFLILAVQQVPLTLCLIL